MLNAKIHRLLTRWDTVSYIPAHSTCLVWAGVRVNKEGSYSIPANHIAKQLCGQLHASSPIHFTIYHRLGVQCDLQHSGCGLLSNTSSNLASHVPVVLQFEKEVFSMIAQQ